MVKVVWKTIKVTEETYDILCKIRQSNSLGKIIEQAVKKALERGEI